MEPVSDYIIDRFNLKPSEVIALAKLQAAMEDLPGNALYAAQVLIMGRALVTAETVLTSLCGDYTAAN